MSKKFWLIYAGYWCLFLGYSIFSYSLTAPNLVLSTNPDYWQWQTWMWQTFFNNRQLLTITYSLILTGLFLGYGLLIYLFATNQQRFNFKQLIVAVLFLVLPLIFSNNALSYDVFNYIFNAKMVAVYHANPHVQTALEFSTDTWTRFMHNTHTPAPYGYGWTALSMIPYAFGLGKFITTWVSFRLFSLLSLFLLMLIYQRYVKKINLQLFMVLFNPLLLIEVVSNSHNDLWMMVPAIVSLMLVSRQPQKIGWSLVLLLFSISIKFATLILLPIWLGLVFYHRQSFFSNLLSNYWPLMASVLMFIPLLSTRSQLFHPWYLIWALVWLPFIKSSHTWINLILIFSASSLFRYLPYLYYGQHTTQTLFQQQLVTWIPALLYLSLLLIKQLIFKLRAFKVQ